MGRDARQAARYVLLLTTEDVRHSTQGRMVSATHVQTGEYLKPLFKGLRRRVRRPTDPASRTRCAHAHRRDRALYAAARVPNGKRLVSAAVHRQCAVADRCDGRRVRGSSDRSIHERSGQEKLYTTNVAHGMSLLVYI